MNTTSDEVAENSKNQTHNVKKHLLSVGDYTAMEELGLFHEKPNVELINGEIFDMAPIGPAHGSVVMQLTKRFVMAVKDSAIVSTQNPIQLGDLSQPEPDLCILHSSDDFYATNGPKGVDVILLVEVAQSSLAFDLTVKARLYSAHKVVEYWLVDLPNKQLMVFKEPTKEGYATITTLKSPVPLYPDALPDIALDMTGLF